MGIKALTIFFGIVLLLPFLTAYAESKTPICETADSLIIVTDKVHYSTDDTILVSGCLSEDIKNEDLRLSVTGFVGPLGGEKKIFLSTAIKPNPDGVFTYEISTEILSGNWGYSINAFAGFQEEHVKVYLSRFGELCDSVSNENPIMVFTDKENYERSDRISVFGCLAEVALTKGINIIVYDENGNRVDSHTFVPDDDATFSTEFEIDDSFAVDGIYTVEVDAAGLYSSSKTIVVPEFSMTLLVVMIATGLAVFLPFYFNKLRFPLARVYD